MSIKVELTRGKYVLLPHYSGAAAILLSNAPTLSPSELKAALLESAVVGAISDVGADSPNRLLYVGQSNGEANSPAPQGTHFSHFFFNVLARKS